MIWIDRDDGPSAASGADPSPMAAALEVYHEALRSGRQRRPQGVPDRARRRRRPVGRLPRRPGSAPVGGRRADAGTRSRNRPLAARLRRWVEENP